MIESSASNPMVMMGSATITSALPVATYTLTYTQTGATLTASVAASGRITIP